MHFQSFKVYWYPAAEILGKYIENMQKKYFFFDFSFLHVNTSITPCVDNQTLDIYSFGFEI